MTNQQNGELVMIICALLHPTAFVPDFCIKSLNTLSFDEKHDSNLLSRNNPSLQSILVITCLWAVLDTCMGEKRAIPKISKITRVIYPQNSPHQTCNYWLITPNQKIFCVEI